MVSAVAVLAEKGKVFAFASPWAGQQPAVSCGGREVQVTKRSDLGTATDTVYSFPTAANASCTIAAHTV